MCKSQQTSNFAPLLQNDLVYSSIVHSDARNPVSASQKRLVRSLHLFLSARCGVHATEFTPISLLDPICCSIIHPLFCKHWEKDIYRFYFTCFTRNIGSYVVFHYYVCLGKSHLYAVLYRNGSFAHKTVARKKQNLRDSYFRHRNSPFVIILHPSRRKFCHPLLIQTPNQLYRRAISCILGTFML